LFEKAEANESIVTSRDIADYFKRSVSGTIPSVNILLKDELAEKTSVKGRIYYSITEKGKEKVLAKNKGKQSDEDSITEFSQSIKSDKSDSSKMQFEKREFKGNTAEALQKRKEFRDWLFIESSFDSVQLDEDGRTFFLSAEVQGTAYEGRTERIEFIKKGDQVQLKRDPENQYDPNCIGVLNSKGESLGNLGQNIVEYLAPVMDADLVEIEKVVVKSVTPLSQRNKRAKKALLDIEIQGKLALPGGSEESCVVCYLGGDQIRVWAQSLKVVTYNLPASTVKQLFEIYNRFSGEYEHVMNGTSPYGYMGLDYLDLEVDVFRNRLINEMQDGLDYSSNSKADEFKDYVYEIVKTEPERYKAVAEILPNINKVSDFTRDTMKDILSNFEMNSETYFWINEIQVSEEDFDYAFGGGFNHWYDVAELYNSKDDFPFDLNDPEISSIFGFNKFLAFADLSYGC
jgi:DNA-binding PadR family transcriptional regulator